MNLSSNNIEDIQELNVLHHVEDLNLSCNKITHIAGLDNMLGSLFKINLSHNRIASLSYFKTVIKNGRSAPNLTSLDFNDNYIGDLAHVTFLKPITSLREVTF